MKLEGSWNGTGARARAGAGRELEPELGPGQERSCILSQCRSRNGAGAVLERKLNAAGTELDPESVPELERSGCCAGAATERQLNGAGSRVRTGAGTERVRGWTELELGLNRP